MRQVAIIVEGHGEEMAVPILARKILRYLKIENQVEARRPLRCAKGDMTSGNPQFRKLLNLAAEQVRPSSGLILILLDADEDCPKDLRKIVRERYEPLYETPVLLAAANRCYEAWLLASWPTVRDHVDVADQALFTSESHEIRNPKAVLRNRMRRRYSERNHQAEFTKLLDIDLARRNPSFDRLVRRLEERLNPSP